MWKRLIIIVIVVAILAIAFYGILDGSSIVHVFKPPVYVARLNSMLDVFPTPWTLDGNVSTLDKALEWVAFPVNVLVWIGGFIIVLNPFYFGNDSNASISIYTGRNAFSHYVDDARG